VEKTKKLLKGNNLERPIKYSTVNSIVVSSRTYVRDLLQYQHFIRSLPSVEKKCFTLAWLRCRRWMNLRS